MSAKRFKLSLFIFRRDLRVYDNSALIAALNESEKVVPCFILDDRQIKNNDYFSEKAFRFMLECLVDLQKQLQKQNGRLYFFKGTAEKIVAQLLDVFPIDAIFFNKDYTPFSIQRDNAISHVVTAKRKKLFIFADALLNEPEIIKKSDGSSYTIFTPFMKKSREWPVAKPRDCRNQHYYVSPIENENNQLLDALLKQYSHSNEFHGGRANAITLLNHIAQLKNYASARDFPALSSTSNLSAHHKFGTISIRETYATIIDDLKTSVLINELYWRDFFTHTGFHFPHVFGAPFHQKYQHIHWKNSKADFEKWCRGETGFPIVDAGMRELNQTGLMHNRVRMIAASFLVKDLHIDWRWGEKYFATHLIDYDPAVNNGNWQWVASTGCDAQPYFRIFNPWLQQKRFDADAIYITKWIPELKDILPSDLHNPDRLSAMSLPQYPKPMIDHAVESKIAKSAYAESVRISR